MAKRHMSGMAMACIVLIHAGCRSSSTKPTPEPGAPAAAGTRATTASNNTTAAPGSAPATGAGGSTGGGPAGGNGTTTPATDAGAAAMPMHGGGGMAAPSSAGSDGGSATSPTVTASMPNIGSVGLGNGGIGVNDLDKATEFFTKLVGMKVQTPMIEREDRFERILTLGEAPDKPSVTLMQYKDGRMIKDIPSKLVFYSQNPSDTVTQVAAGGYNIVLNVGTIAQVTAIDGYLLEFLQDASGPMFISIAFAVSDFNKTNQFYTDAFNLTSTGDYNDVSMMGLSEHFLQAMDGGAALVVQTYSLGQHNYKDNPCKTVWHVKDAAAQLDKVVMLGGTMVSPGTPLPAFNNKITSIAKDFDGYLIEMVQD